MTRVPNRALRVAGTVLAMTVCWYVPWLVSHIRLSVFWLSVPFVLANLLLIAAVLVAVINNWSKALPQTAGRSPVEASVVSVLVPTAGEPVGQVERTVRSVLEQAWPQDLLCVIVSDDARNAALQSAIRELGSEYGEALVIYHTPPGPGDAARVGEAKAGNLNSALAVMRRISPGTRFVETRDADDVVGDRFFLREIVSLLDAQPDVAYIQTIKEASVSPGDPFDNDQAQFYRGSMLARNATNAVFPCGSGLVWRLEALDAIGGFPTWNLVEDLQSGIEALRRGWRGLFLPIVGAVAQHAPEDMPNFVGQRGTWAVDTLRMAFWGEKRGLTLRQRLHFMELPLFYLQGIGTLVFILAPVVGFLFSIYPLRTDLQAYLLHFWPFALCVEAFLAALFYPLPYQAVWRARTIWAGLAPVYARAAFISLRYGRDRKPAYVVTRKTHAFRWYWRESLVQFGLFASLLAAMIVALLHESLIRRFDPGSAYWSVLYVVLLGGFVRLSWFGTRSWHRVVRRARTPEGMAHMSSDRSTVGSKL